MTKGTLIKSSDIKKITGWDKNILRKARRLGWVKMLRENGKIFYVKESINNPYENKTA